MDAEDEEIAEMKKRIRCGTSLSAAKGVPPRCAPLPMGERLWPGKTALALLVLLGGGTDPELLDEATKAAQGDEAKGRLCEAHFYLGLQELRAGHADEARIHLQATVDARLEQFVETGLARAMLSDLRLWVGATR